MLQLTTTIPLLLGLGEHILYSKFFTYRVLGIEIMFLAVSGSVALHHVLMEYPLLTLPVGFSIGARLLVIFVITYDAAGCACTLLGVAVGVLSTDILSQLIEDGDPEDAYYEGLIVSNNLCRRCLVQLLNLYFDNERMRDHNRRRCAFLH
jgi:hypothetical protein